MLSFLSDLGNYEKIKWGEYEMFSWSDGSGGPYLGYTSAVWDRCRRGIGGPATEDSSFSFLATLVALHLTPVSKWVSGQSFELA